MTSSSAWMFLGGGAKKVSFERKTISNVPFKSESYVRDIDSEKHFVWKGQSKLDLADLINGGNGFGTGTTGVCINPATGSIGQYESMPTANYDLDESFMCDVKSLPCVDCVIVPCQNGGNLPITTTGLSISDFPALSGFSRWVIQTKTHNKDYPFMLDGVLYGVKGSPGFSMHANCGITFDLDRIRESIPGMDIVSFSTLCGLSDSRLAGNFDADMTGEVFIFFDGKQVYHYEFAHVEKNAVPIEIDMKQNNFRFMTVVVTCGNDDNKLDWFVFGEPVLAVESDS